MIDTSRDGPPPWGATGATFRSIVLFRFIIMEDARNLRRIGHSDLNGHPDAMQLMLKDHYLFVGHVDGKVGTTILDVSDPSQPRVVNQLPCPRHSHSHKVQIAGDLLLVNVEQHGPRGADPVRTGFQILDISRPTEPRELGFFTTGGTGVHRLWYTGGDTVYLSARPEGFRERIMLFVDISDPTAPREIARWWYPGMAESDPQPPPWAEGRQPWGVHHPVVDGHWAYTGFWGGGMLIFDISEPSRPEVVSHVPWRPEDGGSTHTALPLPGRSLLAVADESNAPHCQEVRRRVRLFDIQDRAQPRLVSLLPEPAGDFCDRGGRFGPHNLHENRPDSWISEEILFVTYFNAGLRIYDISDASRPVEIAHYIPPCNPYAQSNDVFVARDGLIYLRDRVYGGVDILEMAW